MSMKFDTVSYIIGKSSSDSGGGGGGNVPLLTVEQWNSLTTLQKRSYGLIAIQERSSGFNRGTLVYGEEYISVPEEEMTPIYSWNVSNNNVHTYIFAAETLTSKPTVNCLALMSQNGSNPHWGASENLIPALASGNQGNGNWAICYGKKAEGDYATTYSAGDNWNNSQIVCFCFSEDVFPVIKESFYEQGQSGTYNFTYTATKSEDLLLVVMRGGSQSGAVNVTNLTRLSNVTSSGGRVNAVYFGKISSGVNISISIPYASGNNNNGSLLVALLSVG